MLSQIKYKTEQFLLEFNRRYDGIKVMYLALLILLSTAFLLTMFSEGPIEPSGYDQIQRDIQIIEKDLESIKQSLDGIVEILKERNANK